VTDGTENLTERLQSLGLALGPVCSHPLCTGHLGKFPTCLTEALWVASLDGGDDSTGTTEAHGHYTLLNFPDTEDIDISNAPEWQHMVTVHSGWYIVECQDSGAVYHAEYADETEARQAFLVEERRYAQWENQCGSCSKQREENRSDDILCKGCQDKETTRLKADQVKHDRVRHLPWSL